LFTRDIGILGTLDRAGGVETEHDVIGRADPAPSRSQIETDMGAGRSVLAAALKHKDD
jgi:hypothetical protein